MPFGPSDVTLRRDEVTAAQCRRRDEIHVGVGGISESGIVNGMKRLYRVELEGVRRKRARNTDLDSSRSALGSDTVDGSIERDGHLGEAHSGAVSGAFNRANGVAVNPSEHLDGDP